MHSLAKLQKQQVGLRLPIYLIEQIDEFTKEYNLNRTDIIIESIKSYIDKQELQKQYNEFNDACNELKDILDNPEKIDNLQTLDELLDEL
ncbi:MAG: hypothetical protein JJV95_00285 [Sulfurospirillum sp.]|nr:hypothetical protein [Sulfurospirillum sp.]MBL0702404.1 hypothetical protein [Sulfurospirillum sp.]